MFKSALYKSCIHECDSDIYPILNKVFLVAGGYFAYNYRSSTEILVEGGLDWSFQEPLPSERNSLRGISLPDTVLMTGNNLSGVEIFS